MLNIEPSNVAFLKTYNTEFDEFIITFVEQNARPLEIEDKINLKLLINKYKWREILYQEEENILRDMDFYHLRENIKKQLFLNGGLDSLKNVSKQVVHKVDEFIGNKVADEAVTK